MSLSRVVLGCRACSATIARSSASVPSTNATLRASWTPSACFQRPITSTARRRADKHSPTTEDPEFAFLDTDNGVSNSAPSSHRTSPHHDALDEFDVEPTPDDVQAAPPEATPATSISPLPWYLQNREAPTPQQTAIIPPLPLNPPPLLPTLLDYIANTAGLDDLHLLDLRHLDPPPALGPKLIMLVATARSEKHLHVSADRFCRYLRREHGLRANAAGLLGRNELKIKLRRKAKRMKMLANVGGGNGRGGEIDGMANLDDGIRTGWICCTLGKIEAHVDDTHMPGDDVEGFVGFREVRPGVNVVVQMFTEEKRAETDLETLWGGVLRTHERRDSVAAQALRELEEMEQEEEDAAEEEEERVDQERMAAKPSSRRPAPPAPTHQFKASRPSAGDVFPPASPPRNHQQLRRLHTVGLRT
ncbi:hypothetical protein K458DRAFT_474669 [Lentithecium fluviatile CBS 122367]|uniref:ATPase synthesis protein 25 n=1 Tax=Lentithecium fluviatile CBS 122367 TaxID=1168545 RepID=A0A6G1JIW3_9PLEO|nr:hypothetical protein K458DRAFT_474669 [Lentithecium fluviatile CBS 122367]